MTIKEIVYIAFIIVCMVAVFLFPMIIGESIDERRRKKGFKRKKLKPDKPFNFSTDTIWLAVKADDNIEVAKTLGMKTPIRSNWVYAIDNLYVQDSVFVTPKIGDWILVIGSLPTGTTSEGLKDVKKLLEVFSKTFSEAQYFSCFQGYYCFAKAKEGTIERLYAYNYNTHEYDTIGASTKEEFAYKFPNILPWEIDEEDQDYWEKERVTFPTEKIIINIAENWSVNPMTLRNREDIEGLGILNIKNIKSLGELKKAGYQSKTIKDELRNNLREKISKGETVFEGVWGFENTVIPELERAILSRHNINLLGLRGQAKTRLARLMVNLLDEWIPVVEGSEINDDPLNPISRYGNTRCYGCRPDRRYRPDKSS